MHLIINKETDIFIGIVRTEEEAKLITSLYPFTLSTQNPVMLNIFSAILNSPTKNLYAFNYKDAFSGLVAATIFVIGANEEDAIKHYTENMNLNKEILN